MTLEERRRFYRIDDDVVLRYRVISEAVMKEGIQRLNSNRLGRSQLRHAILGMEARIQELVVSIGRARPEFAEVLDLLNKKTSLLERMVDTGPLEPGDDHLTEAPSSAVCLSGGGIAFDGENTLEPGNLLDIDLVLLPAYQYIKAFGRVIPNTQKQRHNQQVPVEFVAIRDEDREEIVQHVFRKQHQQLLQRRLAREGKLAADDSKQG